MHRSIAVAALLLALCACGLPDAPAARPGRCAPATRVQCFAEPCSTANPKCKKGCFADYCPAHPCKAWCRCTDTSDCLDQEYCALSGDYVGYCVDRGAQDTACSRRAPCATNHTCDTYGHRLAWNRHGICRATCNATSPCPDTHYCLDGLCYEDGFCKVVDHCDYNSYPDNAWPHILCTGNAYCSKNRCGWRCGEEETASVPSQP